MTPNGKQDVPSGCYRALMTTLEKTYPATLCVERVGHASCRLPSPLTLGGDVALRFVTAHGRMTERRLFVSSKTTFAN